MSEFGNVMIRRIILAVVSLGVGYVGTFLSVTFILQTVMSDYGLVYIIFTILSIALGVAVWLDHEKMLNTKILPH